MLKELYEYGIRNQLTLPPGFIKKQIRGYISLSRCGNYLGVVPCENEIQPCPDIGSMANSKDKCNALADKLSVVLFLPEREEDYSVKNEFFKKVLSDGAKEVPDFELCLNVLEDRQLLRGVVEEARRCRLKTTDRISFLIDGKPIVVNPLVQQWWEHYRLNFSKMDMREEMH